jgi:hypothetical protein
VVVTKLRGMARTATNGRIGGLRQGEVTRHRHTAQDAAGELRPLLGGDGSVLWWFFSPSHSL